jgi:hypothetical protein
MPQLPGDYEHIATEHLGAWLFSIWKDLFSNSSLQTAGFLDFGFAGDVLSVFRVPATGDVSVLWRLRFGSEDQAGRIVSSVRTDPLLAIAMVGRDVIVGADTRGAPQQSFLETLEWRAVAPDDLELPFDSPAGFARSGALICSQALLRE